MTTHDALLERLVRVGKVAGQDALARLAYQMARRCLCIASANETGNIRWVEDPRSVAAMYSELLLLEARSGLTLKKDDIPLADPTRVSAIQWAHACIDLGKQIEGDSPRVQFIRAQCIRESGGVEEAADRLKVLLQGALTKSWYNVIQESRQTFLLALGNYEEAALIGDILLRRDARRPDAAFNRLTAQAWMGLDSEFQEAANRLRLALEGVRDSGYWSRLISDEAPWLALRFRRDPSEVLEGLALPDSSPSSQSPDK